MGAEIVRYAMLHRLTPNVYYSEHQEATDRPALGYIQGTRASLMVDAGNSPQHARQFLDLLASAQLPPPSHIVLTHWHWDHCYGLCALPGISYAGTKTNQMLCRMCDWQWSDEAMKKRLDTGEDVIFCDHFIRKEYPDRSQIQVCCAQVEFDGKLTIDLGGLHAICLPVENSHSPDCIVVLVPEAEIIFLGDSYSLDFHHGKPHFDPTLLSAYRNALEGLPFQRAVLGHGAPKTREELFAFVDEKIQNPLLRTSML